MIQLLQRISERERILLIALIIVGFLVWGSHLQKRWAETSAQLDTLKRTSQSQSVWLNNEGFLRNQFRTALNRLDMDKVLDDARLIGLIDTYSRQHELRHELSSPTVIPGEIFSRSNLRVTFRNITMEDLLKFYLFTSSHHPYMSLEGIAIVPNRADLRLLTARFRIDSFVISDINF